MPAAQIAPTSAASLAATPQIAAANALAGQQMLSAAVAVPSPSAAAPGITTVAGAYTAQPSAHPFTPQTSVALGAAAGGQGPPMNPGCALGCATAAGPLSGASTQSSHARQMPLAGAAPAMSAATPFVAPAGLAGSTACTPQQLVAPSAPPLDPAGYPLSTSNEYHQGSFTSRTSGCVAAVPPPRAASACGSLPGGLVAGSMQPVCAVPSATPATAPHVCAAQSASMPMGVQTFSAPLQPTEPLPMGTQPVYAPPLHSTPLAPTPLSRATASVCPPAGCTPPSFAPSSCAASQCTAPACSTATGSSFTSALLPAGAPVAAAASTTYSHAAYPCGASQASAYAPAPTLMPGVGTACQPSSHVPGSIATVPGGFPSHAPVTHMQHGGPAGGPPPVYGAIPVRHPTPPPPMQPTPAAQPTPVLQGPPVPHTSQAQLPSQAPPASAMPPVLPVPQAQQPAPQPQQPQQPLQPPPPPAQPHSLPTQPQHVQPQLQPQSYRSHSHYLCHSMRRCYRSRSRHRRRHRSHSRHRRQRRNRRCSRSCIQRRS